MFKDIRFYRIGFGIILLIFTIIWSVNKIPHKSKLNRNTNVIYINSTYNDTSFIDYTDTLDIHNDQLNTEYNEIDSKNIEATNNNNVYIIKNKTKNEVSVKNIDTNKFSILTKKDNLVYYNMKLFNVGDTIIIDANNVIKY